MKNLIVKNLKKEEKLSNYLKKEFPSMPSSAFFKALRQKDIKVNSKRINSDILINNNDEIQIFILDKILYNLPEKIDIIYEDSNILVAFKPQGLLTNDENNLEASLESLLNENNSFKLTLCHRLDRNTAGLVIFSKNDESTKEMLEAFKLGYIDKNYLVYCSNSKFNKKREKLEQYVLFDNKNEYAKIISHQEKSAYKMITEYEVLKTFDDLDYAILNVKIHTGKTHQIRCAMSSISHPIIGDSKYGKNDINKKFKIYKQLLFAYKYTFNFPVNYKLSYLNDITITLDSSFINKSIGSDLIGK